VFTIVSVGWAVFAFGSGCTPCWSTVISADQVVPGAMPCGGGARPTVAMHPALATPAW
jgi:hypothetical protein